MYCFYNRSFLQGVITMLSPKPGVYRMSFSDFKELNRHIALKPANPDTLEAEVLVHLDENRHHKPSASEMLILAESKLLSHVHTTYEGIKVTYIVNFKIHMIPNYPNSFLVTGIPLTCTLICR